jgi:SAM-dependent methyltransferase
VADRPAIWAGRIHRSADPAACRGSIRRQTWTARRPRLAAGEPQIPLRDHSVDAVVSTIVLCSVRDQDQVLAEVRRVLRPGGAALRQGASHWPS